MTAIDMGRTTKMTDQIIKKRLLVENRHAKDVYCVWATHVFRALVALFKFNYFSELLLNKRNEKFEIVA